MKQVNFSAGDSVERFSIQSIAKLSMALNLIVEILWKRLDEKPSDDSFNLLSLTKLSIF